MQTRENKKILLLRPEEIFPSLDTERKSFDEYRLRALAKSISAVGIIEPLCVRQDSKNRYVLLSGERRLKAAKMIGLRRLPCVLHSEKECDAAILSLVSNITRENLNFFEAAQAIDRILAVYGISPSIIADKLGMNESKLQDKLSLLKISPLERERILSAGLSERHAAALLKLNKNDIPLVLNTVIEKNLSAKQTEQFISAVLSPLNENAAPPTKKAAIGNAKFFSNSLSKLINSLNNAGVQAGFTTRETEDFIEYEVRIEKNTVHQLSFSGI